MELSEISEKRLAANRANAKRSTGPRSPMGRRISSRNATRHGFLARAVVIDGESREEFEKLLKSIHTVYHPTTPNACAAAEKVAVYQWRLLRVWTIDSAAFNHEIRRQANAAAGEDFATRAMLAMRGLADNSKHSELISRFEQRLDRHHHRAIQELERLTRRTPVSDAHGTNAKQIIPNEPTVIA